MTRTFRKIPALTALQTFESAARLQSFKDAADELGVTPGAVSHQIKALEAQLGQKLFDRQHRGVQLSTHGTTLFASVESAFDDIAATVRQILASDNESQVTVGATSAVSSLWLSPAILRFWRENNNTSVNQLVSDTRFAGIDTPELYIRYGRDPRPGLEQHVLYRDTLVPVCAPQLARQLDSPDLSELAAQRLIHMETDDANWTNWQNWFQSLGHKGPLNTGSRVNNYTIALAAAEDGAGVVLGWKRLVSPLLQRGTLVVLGQHSLDAPKRFHLITRPEAQLSSAALQLRDWLLSNL